MASVHPLQNLIEPMVESLGYEVVRIMTVGAKNPTLQIMIERQDHADMTVDDCAAVSRAVSAKLDEADPIDGQYALEVSSPGIDRPLTKPEHFSRFAGSEAKIETNVEVEGRKRFKGVLKGIDARQQILLAMDGTEYTIPFAAVSKAKLTLTDDLLAQAAAEEF